MTLWLFLLALQFDPNSSPKFVETTRLLQQQKYTEAILILEELTRAKPTVGEYWFALGVANAANNNIPASLEPFSKACSASLRPSRACYQYGRVLQASGRHADAVLAFDAAGKNAQDSVLLTAKAQSHEALDQMSAADQAYRAALSESALRPANSAEVQLRYGVFLAGQGKFESSRWQLDQVLRKRPFLGPAWREKANVLIALERKEDAIDALEQAISHGERTRENLLLLARLCDELGDKTKAEAYRQDAR